MTFGQRLKELRQDRGLTQEQLAEKINKSKATISSYESGRRSPGPESLKDLADFFSVTIDYLLNRSDLKHDPHYKIKQALEDDPELLDFWNQLSTRDELKLLFKQTKDLDKEGIKSIVQFIKAVESRERR